jgi:hypothetical protein
MKTLLLTLVSLWLSSVGAFGQQPIIENDGMRVPARDEAAANKPPRPASLHLADAIEGGRNLFRLDEVSAAQFAAADEKAVKARPNRGPEPPRVGIVRAVGQTFGPDSFVNVASGAAGERKVWAMAFRSPGAHYLRLRFVNFDAGDASVIVYARNGDEVVTLGPFTGKGPQRSGDFWTLSLPGDTAFLEFSGGGEPRLEVAEVMHYDKLPAPAVQKRAQDLNQAQPPGEHPCFLDVMQESVDPFARDATALIAYRDASGNFVSYCSGTLINDWDGETVVPYFLTASHCDITPANVNSVEALFLFQRDPATGAIPNLSSLPRLSGGVVLAFSGLSGNDMTFLRLNGQVPAGVTLAGWSTGGADNNSFGVHHPNGTFKKASFFIPSEQDNCGFEDNYHIVKMTRGGSAGGSSGSGLFNGAGRLVGQLRGICPAGSDKISCAADEDDRSIYGKFSLTYPLIYPYLEIGGTINVNRFHGGYELGTPSEPFRTVTAGYNFAWDNTRLKIKPGSYNEAITFSKPMTILADGGTVTIGR